MFHGSYYPSRSSNTFDSQLHFIPASHTCCKSFNFDITLFSYSKARFSVKSGQISHRTHLQTQLVSLTGKLSSSQSLPRDAMRKRGISRLPLSSSPSQLGIVSKRLNISIIHSFIRFFNENTVITQWFNNMQCIKHVVTSKCL